MKNNKHECHQIFRAPIQKFGTPKLTTDTFNLVEFGVFVIWWQKEFLIVSNLK